MRCKWDATSHSKMGRKWVENASNGMWTSHLSLISMWDDKSHFHPVYIPFGGLKIPALYNKCNIKFFSPWPKFKISGFALQHIKAKTFGDFYAQCFFLSIAVPNWLLKFLRFFSHFKFSSLKKAKKYDKICFLEVNQYEYEYLYF